MKTKTAQTAPVCWCQEGRQAAAKCPTHSKSDDNDSTDALVKKIETNRILDEQKRMHELFELLCDDLDWRAPIKVTISAPLYFKLLKAFKTSFEELAQAVMFMTATPLSITLQGEVYTLTAPGYRAGPAGP